MQLMVAMMIVLLLAMHCYAVDRPVDEPFTTRSEVIARQGMAATSQPLATQVAIDVLKQGGTAVDAAIAANAVLGLTEPTGCGIGGDLFAIVWDAKTEKLHALNASGRSPRSLKREHFIEQGHKQIPAYHPLSISVPGCVDGWFELHARFGKTPMKQLLAPAIDYAREGFAVSPVIAHQWRGGNTHKDRPNFATIFLPEGKAPRSGDLFKNPMLADTLEKIAAGGRDAFYKGEIARTIDAFMNKHGGFITYDDLATHRSEWVKPVSANYRGYDVWEIPPNGQGIAALQILNVLEGFDLKKMEFGSADYIHHFVEAKKLAFEDRAHLYADMDFAKVPVAKLISKEYAAERRKLIDPKRAADRYPVQLPHALEEGDTIYLTVADEAGNMVSLIQSNYYGFGSGYCPDGLGFCLQNRGMLFDLAEGRFNSYAPGKRPFHTIIPAFITKDGKPYMSFGVMGGATQPQMHAQIVINMIDFGMNLQEAGDAPRIVHSGSSQPTGSTMTNGGSVALESGITQAVRDELKARGHKLNKNRGVFGGYQAIRYDADRGVYFGASESRKDGMAAGY